MQPRCQQLLGVLQAEQGRLMTGHDVGPEQDSLAVDNIINELIGTGDSPDDRKRLIRKWCQDICRSADGTILVQYYKGRGCTLDSRNYSGRASIQCCGSRVRNFVCEGIYRDIDICNCYPSIFLRSKVTILAI